MNVKTTIVLAFLLVVSVFALYVLRWSPPATDAASPPPMPLSTSRDVIEDKPGDIVRMVIQRKGEEAWVFEKDSDADGTAAAEWRMTAPFAMKVARWEVDRIPRQITNLQYDISYEPGQAGGVTAAQAGLDTPEAVITLTDAEGMTATVEIGKPASATTTYVRLGGTESIRVGKSNLRSLLKARPLDYRDLQLWQFEAREVTRLEITTRESGTATNYVFVPRGGGWEMEAPMSARATQKVGDAVRELGRVRAAQWIERDESKLAVYGLDPAAAEIRVTVEREVPVEDEAPASQDEAVTDDADEVPTVTQTEKQVYTLLLSDHNPIGDEGKVYVCVGDEPLIATMLKTTADKLRPAMDEWRDMRVTTADVTAATRIDMNIEGRHATLEQKEGQWYFEPEGARAELTGVAELLSGLRNLKAVAWEDGPTADHRETDDARSEISLTIPGGDVPVRMVFGDYTDAIAKGLRYVWLEGGNSTAKVRSADIERVLRDPITLRDRAVFDMPAEQITQIVFSLGVPYADERLDLTFARGDGVWSMVKPVNAPARADRLAVLVYDLASLRGTAVVAGDDERSAYGLHEPDSVITILRRIPVGETESASASEPSWETYTLYATSHEGGYYAMRSDRPLIYEISGGVHAQWQKELRDGNIFGFDPDEVTSFAIYQAGVPLVFERRDGRWTYQAEADLPLDSGKVAELLSNLSEIRTDRFIHHTAADLEYYGLDEPFRMVTVSLADGTLRTLRMSSDRPLMVEDRGFFAAVDGVPGVFVLSDETATRLNVSLDDLE
jgi:hypothetical protein